MFTQNAHSKVGRRTTRSEDCSENTSLHKQSPAESRRWFRDKSMDLPASFRTCEWPTDGSPAVLLHGFRAGAAEVRLRVLL